MRWLMSFFALAGCGFSAQLNGEDSGDDEPEPPDACVTFSAQLDTCALVMSPALELSGMLLFDTDDGTLVDKLSGMTVPATHRTLMTLGDPVEAILATSIKLAPNTILRAIGARGFAMIATGAITLGEGAVIDVSASGAGARTSTCTDGPRRGEDDPGGAGGGGGAGFGGAGGNGGEGNSDNLISTSLGGERGETASPPLGPRGGCPGATGGDGNDHGGPGGRGGGAVWLAAGNLIELAAGAGINAGGGGGMGGLRTNTQGDAGGGGGGSGGVIWLEAPRVRSTGALAANGGGGGEGSGDYLPGVTGAAGVLGVARAAGGNGGTSTGAAGGGGGHKTVANGDPGAAPQPGGGGGGGGGVGFIRVIAADMQLATVSP